MTAIKRYPHEKLLKQLECFNGLTVTDIDDEDIQEAVKDFNGYKDRVKGHHPYLEEMSIEIAEAIREWIDSEYDEENADEKVEEPSEMIENPIEKIEEESSTAVYPIETKTVALESYKGSLSKNERALELLYKLGKITEITREDLRRAGFDTSYFTSPLTPNGWKGYQYHLIKETDEKVYKLVIIEGK